MAIPVRCPDCGRREARRVIASHLALYAAVPPERLLETIGCRCGRIYEVRARDYHAAARHLTAG